DATTVGDPDPEFVLSGPGVGSAGVQISGVGVRQSGNTFRYTFTGSFGPGQYTVAFVAGSFGDDGGSVNLAQTQTFRVTAASAVRAELAGALADGAAGATTLNTAHAIDVTFFPAPGATLVESSLVAAFSVGGPTAIAVAGAPTRVAGTTYRYTVSGTFAAGTYTLTFAAGSWTDSAGTASPAQSLAFAADVPSAPLAAPSART